MRTTRKLTIVLCVLASGALALAGPVGEAVRTAGPQDSSIHGSIYIQSAETSAGRVAAPGARIAAIETATGEAYESVAAGVDGSYRLAGLPAGSYALAVRTDDGVFLSDSLVGLDAGQERIVSFALQPAAVAPADEWTPEGENEDEDEDEEDGEDEGGGEETPPAGGAPTGTFFSNHPWLGGLTVAGSALAFGAGVNQLTDDNDRIERKASKP